MIEQSPLPLRLALSLAGLALFSLGTGAAWAGDVAACDIHRVATVDAFLGALGPDRVIELAAGLYDLSAATLPASEAFAFVTTEEGRELHIKGARNLVIRGVEGATILNPAGDAFVLWFEGGHDVALEGLGLARPEGAAAGSGGALLLEETGDFQATTCVFTGPGSVAVDLLGSAVAGFDSCEAMGFSQGFLVAIGKALAEFRDCRVAACEGFPLVYQEGESRLYFQRCLISACAGQSFAELREGASLSLVSIEFSANRFETFSGGEAFPLLSDCRARDNSFDAQGIDLPLAAASPTAAGREPTLRSYRHEASGLSFKVPSTWQLTEDPATGLALFMAPEADLFMLAIPLDMALEAPIPASSHEALLAALSSFLYKGMGLIAKLSIGLSEGASAVGLGLSLKGSLDRQGQIATCVGVIYEGKGRAWALIAVSSDAGLLGPGGLCDAVFSSIAR